MAMFDLWGYALVVRISLQSCTYTLQVVLKLVTSVHCLLPFPIECAKVLRNCFIFIFTIGDFLQNYLPSLENGDVDLLTGNGRGDVSPLNGDTRAVRFLLNLPPPVNSLS